MNWSTIVYIIMHNNSLTSVFFQEVETKEKTKTQNKPAEKADDVEKAWPMNKEGSKSLSTAKHFKTETL